VRLLLKAKIRRNKKYLSDVILFSKDPGILMISLFCLAKCEMVISIFGWVFLFISKPISAV